MSTKFNNKILFHSTLFPDFSTLGQIEQLSQDPQEIESRSTRLNNSYSLNLSFKWQNDEERLIAILNIKIKHAS